jgi:hypothetical protein
VEVANAIAAGRKSFQDSTTAASSRKGFPTCPLQLLSSYLRCSVRNAASSSSDRFFPFACIARWQLGHRTTRSLK